MTLRMSTHMSLDNEEIGSDKTVASDAKNIVQECSGSNRRQSDESVMLKA